MPRPVQVGSADTSSYFCYSLTSDWKVGSRMHMDRDGEVKNECVILESDPPRRLSNSCLETGQPLAFEYAGAA